MKLKTGLSFIDFIEEIKHTNRQIICYGAGLVALSTEHIFEDYKIAEKICCFVDRDLSKRGAFFKYGGREIKMIDMDGLLSMDLTDKALLLTLEAFGPVISALEKYAGLNDLPCYVFPELNQSYIASQGVPGSALQTGKPAQIPKMIHYAWLGGGKMKPDIVRCIDSWKKYCHGYEFICWNEDNYDVYQNKYMRQSYDAKKYAFTADFLRLDVLYRHGGIYLDTDVELLKSLDGTLYNKAFAVYMSWAVPTFAVAGCVAGLPVFKMLRDEPRATLPFIEPDGRYNQKISSFYEAPVLMKYGFRKDFSQQTIMDLNIYNPRYFATKGMTGLNAPITADTFAVHYCYGTWTDHDLKKERDFTLQYAEVLYDYCSDFCRGRRATDEHKSETQTIS